jgi:branched-chain amino acid transport system permease protein
VTTAPGALKTIPSDVPFTTPYDLPGGVKWGSVGALFVFLTIFPLVFSNPTVTSVGVFTMMFLIAVVGWNIFSGFTGYVSIGHAAFYGIGQYTAAEIAIHAHVPGGWELFALLPVAGIVCALFAIPIGWVLLRVRKHTFIVLTIAIMFVGQLLAFNWHGFTNGSQGLEVPIAPWQSVQFNQIFYYVAWGCAVIAVITSVFVRRSRYGLTLLAIRDDEERARGLGIHTTSAKLTAFMISAFFVGVAGAIYAPFLGSVYPQFGFDPNYDLVLAVLAFTGGLGTITGPILGCLILQPLQQYFLLQFGGANVFLIVYGVLFALILRFLPEGVVPSIAGRWRSWVSRNRISTGPPLAATGPGGGGMGDDVDAADTPQAVVVDHGSTE